MKEILVIIWKYFQAFWPSKTVKSNFSCFLSSFRALWLGFGCQWYVDRTSFTSGECTAFGSVIILEFRSASSPVVSIAIPTPYLLSIFCRCPRATCFSRRWSLAQISFLHLATAEARNSWPPQVLESFWWLNYSEICAWTFGENSWTNKNI